MARPRKDGLYYFSHDTDASIDPKVEALEALYGNDGYTFYFKLLERIYREASLELDISDAETIQILASKVRMSVQKFEQILQTALKYGAFDRQAYEDRKVLTSHGIKKRAPIAAKLTYRHRMATRKRFERLYNIDIDLWHRIQHQVFKRDNYTCQYCGQRGGLLEVDHALPVTRGGTNDLDNLVTACRHCNRQKRNKTAEEFRQWRRDR